MPKIKAEPVIPAYVEIHFLTSYPSALPNRDDTGFNKSQLFGGVLRTRISSQAQKRRWRQSTDEHAIRNINGTEFSIRSRETIDALVMEPLYTAQAASIEALDAIGSVLNTSIYSIGADQRENRQAMMLGQPEVNYLKQHAEQIAAAHPDDAEAAAAATRLLFDAESNQGDNFRVFRYNARMAAGIEAALFGRMVTSDTRANIDGAIAVAHALTVHDAEHDTDYFTTVDDLHQLTKQPGTAMLGYTQLTSGLYYGYVVADVRQLVSNTEGVDPALWLVHHRTMASQVMHNLIQLIGTVSTAAKLGSTAAYSHASFMMIEMSDRQPRQLADAFRVPSKPILEDAVARLADYTANEDRFIPRDFARQHASIVNAEFPDSTRRDSVSDLALWVQEAIASGTVN